MWISTMASDSFRAMYGGQGWKGRLLPSYKGWNVQLRYWILDSIQVFAQRKYYYSSFEEIIWQYYK